MNDAGPSSSAWQTWQQAWDAAGPTISSLRASLDSNTFPSARTVRVAKLDSELLDQELVHLLYEPLRRALSIANTALHTRFDLELSLFIQLTLYKFSIWNLGASYGARLQGLRYHAASNPLSPSGLPRRTVLTHGTLTVLVPYFYNRLRTHALSQAWPDRPSGDKRRMAWQMLTRLEASHSLLSLVNFIVFLWNGRYRSLADRLLKMSLVPTTNQTRRQVSYEFMNRQMVWHAFTEFLLFFLPLIKTRTIKHHIARLMSRITIPTLLPAPGESRNPPRKHGKYESLPMDQCAICAENASYSLNLGYSAAALSTLTPSLAPSLSHKETNSQRTLDDEVPAFPIYTPYITSCGHIYCYHCISERMMRIADEGSQSGWECLRCAEIVRSADRWEVEQLPRHSDTNSDYEFSSEFDTTEMSGSVSSYLGSLSE